jgi:hypothetical protein
MAARTSSSRATPEVDSKTETRNPDRVDRLDQTPRA